MNINIKPKKNIILKLLALFKCNINNNCVTFLKMNDISFELVKFWNKTYWKL